MKRIVPLLAVALVAATPGLRSATVPGEPAQPAARAEVLVLGVYHMANRGRDVFNMNANDVLAPKRQTEIAQLIDVLKRFQPTKIAVEADVSDDTVPNRYADYVAGKLELSRDETEQIGFRLAKELGHKTVHPVDVSGEFPHQRLVNYAKASGRSKELDAIMGEFGARVKAQGQYLESQCLLTGRSGPRSAESWSGMHRSSHRCSRNAEARFVDARFRRASMRLGRRPSELPLGGPRVEGVRHFFRFPLDNIRTPT